MDKFKRINKRNKCGPCSVIMLISLYLLSCESFLTVDLPTTLVSQDQVYADDITATSAIKGLYVDLIDINNFASGSNYSVGAVTGLSADELRNYTSTNLAFVGFEQNNLTADNLEVLSLWSSAYKTIYDANSAINGLQSSTTLTTSVKEQLLGESLFIRSYCYFVLVNLFGPVPLITTLNYTENSSATRASTSDVYAQIVSDLQEARTYLSEKYQSSPDRARINKHAATALLARVHLYINNWDSAEALATVIIDNTSVYQLANDINTTFLASSREAIWQLRMPEALLKERTTNEGNFFYIQYTSDISYNILTDTLYHSFAPNDPRRKNWIGKYYTGTDTVYFPTKYKLKYGSTTATENSAPLRLAEIYLIRAEARAMLDDLQLAIKDLDMIRNRAGLTRIENSNFNISKDSLLRLIEQERQRELFTEGGHRWFDLKRTNRANVVLGSLKKSWMPTDELYPIPQSELIKNKNLNPQNTGY